MGALDGKAPDHCPQGLQSLLPHGRLWEEGVVSGDSVTFMEGIWPTQGGVPATKKGDPWWRKTGQCKYCSGVPQTGTGKTVCKQVPKIK